MPTRLLFVCWGNICRSPTAEGIMRRLVADAGLDGAIEVDSVGTSNEHPGEPPDRRAIAEARRRGIDISGLRARQVRAADFAEFDLLLVVDGVVENRLRRVVSHADSAGKIRSLASYGTDPLAVPEVPDPWYGGSAEFVVAFDQIEDMCRGLLEAVRPSE